VSPVTRTSAATLSAREKAAVIVRLLLAEGADLPLADLPDHLHVVLARQVGRMPAIDRETLEAVVSEFCTLVEDVGLSFPADLHGALGLLDGHISPAAAARLRGEVGLGPAQDPWQTLAALDADRLHACVLAESNEVAAILLSKIAVSKAADILGRLPGDRARRIAYAVSQTETTPPATVERIGQALFRQLTDVAPRAFEDGPVERVGAILNFSPATTRDDVLKGLEETDPAFADEVRKAIFTFANIPTRIDPRDIPKILRAVEQATLVTAFAGAKGADAQAAEFVLSGISQRMAASLREEMAALKKVSDKDAEAAMTAVVSAIRGLEAAGELFLVAVEED
jgi:flagellar motor switch protein FliG